MNRLPTSQTGYYGSDGKIGAVFGGKQLAPSLLTGNGSYMALWINVVIHVLSLCLTFGADIVFLTSSRADGADLWWWWALVGMIFLFLGITGVLVSTAFVKDSLSMPLMNTLGAGLFLAAFIATAKMSYSQAMLPAESTENVLFNLAILAQGFGIASLFSNALTAASIKGGL